MTKARFAVLGPHRWRPHLRGGLQAVIVLALIAAGITGGVLAAVGKFAGAQVDKSAVPPRPTTTPAAPGIVIAEPNQFDLADPMLLAVNGTYHLYLETALGDQSNKNVPELVGRPGHWGRAVEALPVMPGWARSAPSDVWDPYVAKIGGNYLMYFTTPVAHLSAVDQALNLNGLHCLGVARSTTAIGPFVPVGDQPIVCQSTEGGDIDVQPFYDPNGPDGSGHPWYLIWKSDDNNLRHPRPTAIWSAPLSNDGLHVDGKPKIIFHGHKEWEKPVLEAPQMVKRPDGGTWLFFSAGTGFYTNRYGIGVAQCDGPIGPCFDPRPGPLVSTNLQGAGPGEETAYVGQDGSIWILYSPWHIGTVPAVFRPVEAVRIGWNSRGPYLAQAGRFPSPGS